MVGVSVGVGLNADAGVARKANPMRKGNCKFDAIQTIAGAGQKPGARCAHRIVTRNMRSVNALRNMRNANATNNMCNANSARNMRNANFANIMRSANASRIISIPH